MHACYYSKNQKPIRTTPKKSQMLSCNLYFITKYFYNFSMQLQDYEALGVSNVVSSLMLFFPPQIFLELPKDLLQHFVQDLTKLTCAFGQSAAMEEAVSC